MAISFQISEYVDLGRLPAERVPLVSLPPLKAKRYSAVGAIDPFQPEARAFRIRNLGDALWFRVRLVTANTLQAGDNLASEWLETGDVNDFMLPYDAIPSDYTLDVRTR
jgi:hypothetical protein